MAKPTLFPVTADVILIARRLTARRLTARGGTQAASDDREQRGTQTADEFRVLLIERGNDPFKGMYAFPGGFVDPGELIEQAALRELAEETSLRDLDIDLVQVGAYGPGGGRDPRGETLTVAFLGVVPEPLPVRAEDDAAAAEWMLVDEALEPGKLAFDHTKILIDALRRMNSLPRGPVRGRGRTLEQCGNHD